MTVTGFLFQIPKTGFEEKNRQGLSLKNWRFDQKTEMGKILKIATGLFEKKKTTMI